MTDDEMVKRVFEVWEKKTEWPLDLQLWWAAQTWAFRKETRHNYEFEKGINS